MDFLKNTVQETSSIGEMIGAVAVTFIIILSIIATIKDMDLTKQDVLKFFAYVAGAALLIFVLYHAFTLPPSNVKVKYRADKVRVSGDNFSHLKGGGTVGHVWYDKSEQYLIIQLNDTNYHYCEVPPKIWRSLGGSKNPYEMYNTVIKGNYDCRIKHLPRY